MTDDTPKIITLPIVGVMGSGSDEHHEQAEALGHWLAAKQVHLLTGGGNGVMLSVSRAFASVPNRCGWILGVLPGETFATGYRPVSGYPNPYVEIPIRTHLPLSGLKGTDPMSRNHINILTADLIIAMPGGRGTSSEVRLALHYRKPVIAHVRSRDQIPDLPPSVPAASDLDQLEVFLKRHLCF